MVGLYKITGVSALPEHRLSVHFWNGVTKIYDMRRTFEKWPQFKELVRNERLFAKVKVDVGGYGIVWNDELDLSCDELWHNGRLVTTVFDGILALSDASVMWGLSESALRKAISYGRFAVGADVCKYGKQWVISCHAMTREYGEPASR